MREQIEKAVDKVFFGSRQLRITFKPEKMVSVKDNLLTLKRRGILSFDEDKWKMFVLMFIMKTGDWESKYSRAITVTLGDKFDASWFVGLLVDSIEDIKAVS